MNHDLSIKTIQIGSHKVTLDDLSAFLILNQETVKHPHICSPTWSFVMYHPELPIFLEYVLNPFGNVMDFRFTKLKDGETVFHYVSKSNLMIGLKKEYSSIRGCIMWTLYDEPQFLGEYYDIKERFSYKCKKEMNIPVFHHSRPGDFGDSVIDKMTHHSFPHISQYRITREPYYFCRAVFIPRTSSLSISIKNFSYDYSFTIKPEDSVEKYQEYEAMKEMDSKKELTSYKGRLFGPGEKVFQLVMNQDFLKEYFGL
jgi:hypothetical protein